MSKSQATASTIEIGDSFRDAVCDLLRTQFPDAKPEQYLGGTKVDILFSTLSFGKRERFAVECKNYDVALTKADFEKIYAKYQPLIEGRQIERVLIVSQHTIGAPASDYVGTWRAASHLTIRELEEFLLGIRRYIEALADLQPTEDAQYVEARFAGVEGLNALDSVDEWIRNGTGNGLAILGSYGQGKTSLARHLAGHYARAYLQDSTQRIPILKKLGEVVHETRLEALLGAEFTADSPSPGYQFKTFDHLNRNGRLLILLDGFDEMKHAMTASDFLSNFREFNRLLQGKSKVILLGRPNALPTDSQDLVFRGMKRVAGQVVASAEFTPWREQSLAFFTPEESEALLRSSLDRSVARYQSAGRFTYRDSFVEDRTVEVLRLVPADLLSRPVHVQLIAELAADPGFDFAGFNRYRLYDHFIRSMVERDTTQKRARKAIQLDDRLRFQRDLAWWAWARVGKSQGSFTRDEIPNSLLDTLPDGGAADMEGKRNEYIVSTLTEDKDGGVLYFAHRSFQEFLVAERLRLAKPDPNAHLAYAAHLTPDIADFLRQAPDVNFVVDWCDTLSSCQGPLPGSYLRFFAEFPILADTLAIAAKADPAQCDLWTVAIVTLSSRAGLEGALSGIDLERVLLTVIREGSRLAAAMATLALVARQQAISSAPLLIKLTAGLIERCLRHSRQESDPSALSIEVKLHDFAAAWLGQAVKRVFPSSGLKAVQLEFDLGQLVSLCLAELGSAMPEAGELFGDLPQIDVPVSVESKKVFDTVDQKVRQPYGWLINTKRQTFPVVAYESNRRAFTAAAAAPRLRRPDH
ncbi:MAG: NACHT domain-containing protein [Burkholderiales bacterium]|nr:NACHT domain-containing protein [Burkholderiales bacterium]